MAESLMPYFPALRSIHVAMVILTGALMVLRIGMAFRGRDYRRDPWLRIAPHIIDTALLASAVLLALATAQYPFVQAWLSAKLVALCLYIACGAIALDLHRTESSRKVASTAALLLLAYIVLVAITRNPLIFIW